MKTIAKVFNPLLLSTFCFLSVLFLSIHDASAYTVYITDPPSGYSTSASSIWVNWHYIPEAVAFRVDVSSNSDFSSSNSSTFDYNITGVQITNLPQNDDYKYIRITAHDGYGGSASNWIYILSNSFTWPAAPTLTSPSNNSYVNGSQADLYNTIPAYSSDMQMVIALDPFFSEIYYNSNWYGSNFSHSSMTGLLDDGQPFYWKVRAENLSGVSNWSSTYKFTNGNSLPLATSPIAPCNGVNASDTTVNFTWQPVAHASGYYGLIARDYNFNDITNMIYTGETNESLTDFLNDGRIYYWKIGSFNFYGFSPYNNICSFQNGIKTATPTIQTNSLPNAYLGMPYTSTVLQATGGFTPYTWSIWNGDAYWQFRILPPGLNLDPSSGVISGTPTLTGSYEFRVQVLDSQPPQLAGYKPLYIPVYSSAIINTTSLPAGNVDSSYSQSLSASGGSGSYTWSLDSGSLPSGLSLSSSGAISGTISGSGSATFTVRVRDAQYPSATTTRQLTITVYPQLQILTDFLPAAAGNVSYNQSLAASGGNGSYSWSIDSGSLPPNFTLSSGGTISGTPISSGNYNFTVKVNDSQNPQKTAIKPLTMNIYANLSVTTSSISNGTSGTAYSQQLYASGGNGSYVWSVASGSLPAGLSLSSNGTLGGIPADVGQFSFTAQVTDTQNSPPASYSYTMTITNGAMQQCADNPLIVSSGASPNICTRSTTNVISGVVDHDQELFTTSGGMQNIAISLFYKSFTTYNSSLGIGWSHSYNISLTLNADASVILRNGNGDKRYYTKSGSNYVSPTGDFSTLVKNGDNTYTISYRDGSKYNFDTVGKITSLIDRYQNAITFVPNGNTLTITDSTGRFATITYDQSTTPQRILTITDPNYNVYNFSYQGSNLYRVTNPIAVYGATRGYWEYQYNADGLLQSKRDPKGYISQYSYYADKKMQTATDPNGRTRTLVYPTTTGTLRTSTLTEKDGGQWLYTYDSTTGVIKQKTDPNLKVTDFYYYANGLVKAKTEPKDGTTRLTTFYKYDDFGNIIIETEPTDISVYSPPIDIDNDDVASLASKTPPIKAIQHYVYDTDLNNINNPYHYDRITSVADERGSTTRNTSLDYTKDSYGEVITATATPGNNVTTTRKNSNGSVRESVDANGKTTNFTYYAEGNYNRLEGIVGLFWHVTFPDGTSTLYSGYDKNGNVFRVFPKDNTGADNYSTIYQFDNLNRLIQQIKIPNTLPVSTTSYDYDLVGNLKSVIDAEQHETKYEYNYNRQATKITDAKLNDTIFRYSGSEGNGVDKLVGVYDANVAKSTPLDSQPHTAYIYDDLGRLESETDPLGKKLYYTYYDNGMLKEKYDATSATPGTLLVTYTYNNRGQITDKTFTDGTYEQYTYTANGQLETAGNQNITYTYAYYTDGRLQSVTDNNSPTNRKISYDQYDALGQRKQVTILKDAGTDQRIINYDYDTANRPFHITSTAGQFTYGYDTSGRRQTVTYPNPTPNLLTANFVYDELNRLTSLTHKNGTAPFATFSYDQYDNVGNRMSVSGSKSETYGYDELYRLTSVTAPKSEGFTYDPAGNRLTGPGAADTAFQSNTINQMTHGRKLTYGYDNRGNQNKRTVTGVPDKEKWWTLDWDNENRLKSMTKVKKKDDVVLETRAVTYKYDPFGRRIEKKFEQTKGGVTETETTNYVYDNEDIVVEYFTTAGGTEKTFYTHGHGIDEPLAMERGGSYYYFHADGLGSITHITNSAKAVVQSYIYDAYGMSTLSASFRNSYQHTGREYDWETGTLYMRERTRDLIDGNFVSKDPLSFQAGDINLYRYVQNNPVNYIDPLGLSGRSVILGGVSVGLNTAALALTFNPPAAAVVKWMGMAASGLTVANAYYEYRTGQMSGTEFAFTAGTEATNVLGGFAVKPVEVLVTGLTRSVGVTGTTIDAVKTFSPQTTNRGGCK